ncbi:hypothetical protein [Paenibacillus lutimineralis]|nr:hypothetical protein [Paenibacillus lutimineralis]
MRYFYIIIGKLTLAWFSKRTCIAEGTTYFLTKRGIAISTKKGFKVF